MECNYWSDCENYYPTLSKVRQSPDSKSSSYYLLKLIKEFIPRRNIRNMNAVVLFSLAFHFDIYFGASPMETVCPYPQTNILLTFKAINIGVPLFHEASLQKQAQPYYFWSTQLFCFSGNLRKIALIDRWCRWWFYRGWLGILDWNRDSVFKEDLSAGESRHLNRKFKYFLIILGTMLESNAGRSAGNYSRLP